MGEAPPKDIKVTTGSQAEKQIGTKAANKEEIAGTDLGRDEEDETDQKDKADKDPSKTNGLSCPWSDSLGSAKYIYNQFWSQAKSDGKWVFATKRLSLLLKCLTTRKPVVVKSPIYSYFQVLVKESNAEKEKEEKETKPVTHLSKKLNTSPAPWNVRKIFMTTAFYLYYRSQIGGLDKEPEVQEKEVIKFLTWTAGYLYFMSLVKSLTGEMIDFKKEPIRLQL